MAAALLSTTGCAGSLMHHKTVAAMRAEESAETTPQTHAEPTRGARPEPQAEPQMEAAPAAPAAPETPPVKPEAESQIPAAPLAAPVPQSQQSAIPNPVPPQASAPAPVARKGKPASAAKHAADAAAPAAKPAASTPPAPPPPTVAQVEVPRYQHYEPPVTEGPPITVERTRPPRPKPPPPPPPPVVYPNTEATIAFTMRPAEHCATCQTVKITVSPTGEVLVERGAWDITQQDWKYEHATSKVKRPKVNAFAANLNFDRPIGNKALTTPGVDCRLSTREESLTIEWMEYGRHDQLDVTFDCSAGGDTQLAQRLRHMPNVLGLRKIAVP